MGGPVKHDKTFFSWIQFRSAPNNVNRSPSFSSQLPPKPTTLDALRLIRVHFGAFFHSNTSKGGALFVDEREVVVFYRILFSSVVFALLSCVSLCQQALPDNPTQPVVARRTENNDPPPSESKRILGIIPNYRTSPSLIDYEPLTPQQKFMIAAQDSFDRGTVVLAAAFAGQGQLTNANRSFGQGTAGYARYFGTAYADLVIGDYMTEAIYPTILHQDPRYFRRGTGSAWSRFGYAVGQIFWTHADTSRGQFNFSEILGNSTAVAISNAYYRDNRDTANAVSKLGLQIGVDMAANVLKEFWPELQRKFRRKHPVLGI